MTKLPENNLTILPFPNEDDHHITMSNRLARSAQSLNLSEKRLIALALSQTDALPQSDSLVSSNNSGWKVRVNAIAYAKAFGVDATCAYDQIKDAAERIFTRYVHYETKTARGRVVKHDIRWVSSASYAVGSGYIDLNFTPEIAPHLLGLKKQFTSYKLTHAASLNSIYSWRLYEVLKSWQSTGVYAPTIEEFWEVMEAPVSLRKNFAALKDRVINPATTAICAKTPMTVEWNSIKGGSRRITSLEFRIRTAGVIPSMDDIDSRDTSIEFDALDDLTDTEDLKDGE